MHVVTSLAVGVAFSRLTWAAPVTPQPREPSVYGFHQIPELDTQMPNVTTGSEQTIEKHNGRDVPINTSNAASPVNKTSAHAQSQDIVSRQVTINVILQWFKHAGITVEDVLRDHALLESRSPTTQTEVTPAGQKTHEALNTKVNNYPEPLRAYLGV